MGYSWVTLSWGWLSPAYAVWLRQLDPCWSSNALHLTAVPCEPLPCSALMSPWEKDAPHHLWSPWHSRGFRLGTTESHTSDKNEGHSLTPEPSKLDLPWQARPTLTLVVLLQLQCAWLLFLGGGSSTVQVGALHKMQLGLGREDGGPSKPTMAPVGWAALAVPQDPGSAPEELPLT